MTNDSTQRHIFNQLALELLFFVMHVHLHSSYVVIFGRPQLTPHDDLRLGRSHMLAQM